MTVVELFTVFEDGFDVANYWEAGPDLNYKVRIISTTAIHLLLDVIILVTPISWILRLDNRRYRIPVYLLIFLAGVS